MRKVIWSEYITKVEYNDGSIEDAPKNDLVAPNQSGVKRRFSDLKEQGEAIFHQWGVDSPCEGSTFSTAIIELENGTVKNIPPEQIRFISGELMHKVTIEGSGEPGFDTVKELKKQAIKDECQAGWIFDNRRQGEDYTSVIEDLEQVVGNIYENPELLK